MLTDERRNELILNSMGLFYKLAINLAKHVPSVDRLGVEEAVHIAVECAITQAYRFNTERYASGDPDDLRKGWNAYFLRAARNAIVTASRTLDNRTTRRGTDPRALQIREQRLLAELRASIRKEAYLETFDPEIDYVSMLYRAIDKLRDSHRAIIIHCFFAGYSQAELARWEGVSREAIRIRLERALARLRYFLGVSNVGTLSPRRHSTLPHQGAIQRPRTHPGVPGTAPEADGSGPGEAPGPHHRGCALGSDVQDGSPAHADRGA